MFFVSACWRAFDFSSSAVVTSRLLTNKLTITAVSANAVTPTIPVPAGFRRTHLAARSARPMGRAQTGSPFSHRPRSSAIASADLYRRPGSFDKQVRQIVSRSRSTFGHAARGRAGSRSRTRARVSSASLPLNGGRLVSSS